MPVPGYLTATLGDLEPRVVARLQRLERDAVVRRVWDRDPTVWGGTASTPELADRLAWLDAVSGCQEALIGGADFLKSASAGFPEVVLCGMGGSSLAPEVIVATCGHPAGAPRFHMLDCTAAAAVASATHDVANTLFVISSKSGSTIETLSFQEYFWSETGGRGQQFVAITDPGSGLERTAKDQGFAHVFSGDPEIGGRFSALSPFGIVPAALAGVAVDPLLATARAAADSARLRAGPDNPAAWLGVVMGEAALAGRDKMVLALSPGLASFGLWVEQLVAESTGKGGVGVLPVCGFRTDAEVGAGAGADRLIVTLRLAEERFPDDVAGRIARAKSNGTPVVELVISEPADLGGEFFRWEFATAIAGAVLGVNPFDQPNVAESKANTTAVLDGAVSAEIATAPDAVSGILDDLRPGDYLALLGYVAPSPEWERAFEDTATRLEAQTGVAVTWGYGPRYLHSTGQLHKGGPPRGAFVQVVEGTTDDLPIPGRPFSFGQLFAAQADGDYTALANRGRPIVRVSGLGDIP